MVIMGASIAPCGLVPGLDCERCMGSRCEFSPDALRQKLRCAELQPLLPLLCTLRRPQAAHRVCVGRLPAVPAGGDAGRHAWRHQGAHLRGLASVWLTQHQVLVLALCRTQPFCCRGCKPSSGPQGMVSERAFALRACPTHVQHVPACWQAWSDGRYSDDLTVASKCTVKAFLTCDLPAQPTAAGLERRRVLR